jgi:membrane dipeptidase
VLTLVWNNHLSWIRSCQPDAGADVPAGLSSFGRGVVRAMNELGMLVDLSHAGERSFYDALDATAAPVIASHSGCMALHAHPRNLTDDQLRALAANGGVVGIVFHPGFLGADGRAEEERVRKTGAYRALEAAHVAAGGAPEDAELFGAQARHLRAHAAPFPAERLVEHVLHAIEVAGIDHVGVGSDYDGIQRAPVGLEDASCYGRLAELLLARGLAAQDVRQVLGGNLERVFAAVTGGSGATGSDGGPTMGP